MLRVLWTLVVAGLVWAAEPKVDRDVAYSEFKETVLDVYQPADAATGKRPGVVVIHGGGWIRGDRASQIPIFVNRYLSKGFVVANVEYRLAPVATAPAAVTDALTAVAWFKKNAKKYNVDEGKIVVTGGSAGGHLALMCGLTPKSAKLGPVTKVAAVVNFYGITDVYDQLQGPNMRDYAVQWVPDGPGRLELATKVSPMTYVRKDVPPILTIHGTADPTVPYEHGVELTRKLRAAGADAEMISVPGGKHGFPQDVHDKLFPQIMEFLSRRGIVGR